MTVIAPPRIRRGETLGIVAPAGPVNYDRLLRGLARLGDAFELRLSPTLTGSRAAGVPSYLQASDDVRADELNAMLRDPDVRGILLARGGYGLMRILARLDADALRADPKPIIGFSDATALLAWAWTHGVRGVHGPMGVSMGSHPESDITRLVQLITEPKPLGVQPWPLVPHGAGQRRGPLITGNLTLMSVLVGTPWALPFDNAIVLVEEVGERPYELDRYMTHLSLSGALTRASALVVGDLVRCADGSPPSGTPDPDDAALQVLLERAASIGLSVAVGAPIGHGDRNAAVPFGADSILDLDAGTLEITEAAVA